MNCTVPGDVFLYYVQHGHCSFIGLDLMYTVLLL